MVVCFALFVFDYIYILHDAMGLFMLKVESQQLELIQKMYMSCILQLHRILDSIPNVFTET